MHRSDISSIEHLDRGMSPRFLSIDHVLLKLFARERKSNQRYSLLIFLTALDKVPLVRRDSGIIVSSAPSRSSTGT